MKVSQMIKNLQKFMQEHGDLDCWYSVDDEGNECHDVYLPPSLCYVDDECAFYGSMEDVRYCGIEPEEVHAVCMVN